MATRTNTAACCSHTEWNGSVLWWTSHHHHCGVYPYLGAVSNRCFLHYFIACHPWSKRRGRAQCESRHCARPAKVGVAHQWFEPPQLVILHLGGRAGSGKLRARSVAHKQIACEMLDGTKQGAFQPQDEGGRARCWPSHFVIVVLGEFLTPRHLWIGWVAFFHTHEWWGETAGDEVRSGWGNNEELTCLTVEVLKKQRVRSEVHVPLLRTRVSSPCAFLRGRRSVGRFHLCSTEHSEAFTNSSYFQLWLAHLHHRGNVVKDSWRLLTFLALTICVSGVDETFRFWDSSTSCNCFLHILDHRLLTLRNQFVREFSAL